MRVRWTTISLAIGCSLASACTQSRQGTSLTGDAAAKPDAAAPQTVQPRGVLERVKARGMVRCGSVERPGLAQVGAQGGWSGLEVDVCRAIAVATVGSVDRVDYRAYGAPRSFDAVRSGQDDVSFLTGAEVSEQKLAGHVLPVATVFIESHAVMVPAAAREQHVRNLAGASICAMIGSSSERGLENYFESLHKSWFRQPFSEDGEMQDAYKVQLCRGIAGELTSLAQIAREPGVNRLSSRILPEPLEVFPIISCRK